MSNECGVELLLHSQTSTVVGCPVKQKSTTLNKMQNILVIELYMTEVFDLLT